MKSRVYNIKTLGNIEVCKHHNAKRLTIKLKPGEIPKVVIPKLMSFDMGYRFAVEKEQWIIEHISILNKKNTIAVYDQNRGFKTRFHEIIIKTHNKNSIQTKNINNTVYIYIPENKDVQLSNIQEIIKDIITEVLRFEAKKYLMPRLNELAKKHGFTFNNVYIKNLKSRWGSCSGKNNINLNLHLMRLPEYLSDFIILHELCHTVHKNHGAHFHELLNKIVGNEKLLNKDLKKYTTQL